MGVTSNWILQTGKIFILKCFNFYICSNLNTVRQVWQYGKERGAAYFTPARSGVQYLEQTGNRLICPGMSNVLSNGNRGARVTEVDPETQDVVFELELEDAIYQRVYRMSLYPENQ